jgi:homoserine kinase type II
MSVFTSITEQQLNILLSRYDLGQLVEYKGISAGIENSNFFVTTDQHAMVLTIYEHHNEEELGFFTRLIQHLGADGNPVPTPFANNNGDLVEHIANKPCAFFPRLKGDHIRHASAEACDELGKVLAKLHLSGQSFKPTRLNDRDIKWCAGQIESASQGLSTEDQQLLDTETKYLMAQQAAWQQLPQGIIHADLFHDNALFFEGKLSGLIDFYNACNDILIYDLAICANDWCIDEQGALDQNRLNALLDGYNKVRPLSQAENTLWNDMLRLGALRFWISRLLACQQQSNAELTIHKDPNEFKQMLLLRQQG